MLQSLLQNTFQSAFKEIHGIKHVFAQHVFMTTGYVVSNQKAMFSYLYRENEDIRPPVPMNSIDGPHTNLQHEDTFLRTINASLYYGKGYPQYLYSEKNKDESMPVFESVRKYILQDRAHLKGTHPIYNRMMGEGILKVPFLYTTQVIYANYTSRAFYTFAKLCDNRIIEEVVINPTDIVEKRAVIETIERYIVVQEDTTEKFMKGVIMSLMLKNDMFALSKVPAKILDASTIF